MTPWCKHELWEMAFKVLGGDLAKRLLGVGMIWPKGLLGANSAVSPGTKESFGQITPTPRSLLAKSPPKTLQAISRSSSLHQGVVWPNQCRSLDLEVGEAGRCIGGIFPTLRYRSRSGIICCKHRQVFVFIGKVTRCVGYHNFRLNGQTLDHYTELFCEVLCES